MTNFFIITREHYSVLMFLLGIFTTTSLALMVACLIQATKRTQLNEEIKQLRRRLETYMLGAGK